jgi:hypothetical protein
VARSRTVLAAVAAAAGLALSACSAHPGSAAVVGDESISDVRVDDVACARPRAVARAAGRTSPAAAPARARSTC